MPILKFLLKTTACLIALIVAGGLIWEDQDRKTYRSQLDKIKGEVLYTQEECSKNCPMTVICENKNDEIIEGDD